MCGRSTVDAPLWRHDGLLVLQPNYTGFLRLTHYVANLMALGQIKVIICLDTATMSVRRHGVPYATLLQLGQPHLQLAWTFLKHGVNNELIDGAQVALSL